MSLELFESCWGDVIYKSLVLRFKHLNGVSFKSIIEKRLVVLMIEKGRAQLNVD